MKRDQPAWRRYARMLGANPRADTEHELEFHYEMRVRDNMRRGMTEEAARAAARERLGDIDTVKAECTSMGEEFVQEDLRRERMGEFRQDVKYGIRVLLRSPLFALIAIVTLGLGIGATTAIFSLVNGVLLAPLPYADSDRIVRLFEVSPQGNNRNPVSPGNVVSWQERAGSFEAIGAHSGAVSVSLIGDGNPVVLQWASISPEALRVLGVPPVLGRWFSEEDAEAPAVALISRALWQQNYGGSRDILGKQLMLDGVGYTVVGVMPEGFTFPAAQPSIWRPLLTTQLDPTERVSHNWGVIAKLAPSRTIEMAQAEMSGVARALAAEYPAEMTGWDVNVVQMQRDITAEVRPLLILLLCAVGLVLLIACGNLANLLLARAVSREREIAVRGALGASRTRIARQLLTESLLIAAAGGVVGVAIGAITLRLLLAVAPENMPLLERVSVNPAVLLFATLTTVLSAIVFGLAPAMRLARSDLQSVLRGTRGASGGVHHTRLRAALLVSEVALAVMLLVGAGLLVRSFAQLNRTDLGYNTEDLQLLFFDLPQARYAEGFAQIAFYDALAEQLRAIPGVVSVGGSTQPPAYGYNTTFSYNIEGRVATNPNGREDPEEMRAVLPGFFQTAGLPVVRGRAFTANDRADAPPVAIINEALARKQFPNEDPIGKRIVYRVNDTPWMEIVGVVRDARMETPETPDVPAIYMPYAQKTWTWLSFMGFFMRVAPGTDVEALKPLVEQAVWELDREMPIQTYMPIDDVYAAAIARRTFAMTLLAGFAGLALILSVVGLYGLIAYTVAQQQQEIGVRMALGARAGDVIGSVVGRSVRLGATGVVVGLAAALPATRLLESMLFGVSPFDPLTFGAIATLVLVVTALAAWLPARRAARTSPLTALRHA